MAKCDLSIVLDNGTVPPGGQVSGYLDVNVNKNCKCKALTLEAVWSTRSRAAQAKGVGASVQLFQGEWQGGEANRYPFNLTLPPGPCSYNGNLLSVGWNLRARADIPWAIDPKAGQPFTMKVAPVDGYYAGPAYAPPQPAQGRSDMFRLIRNLIIGLVIGVVAFVFLQREVRESWVYLVPLAPVVLAFLFSLGIFRRAMASRRIGIPEVTFDPLVPAPGTPLMVTLKLEPHKPLEVNSAKVRLQAFERIVYSETYYSGGKTRTRRVTKTHSLFDMEQEVETDAQALAAARGCTVGTVIDIPPDAAVTFAARDNNIFWQATVHIDIARWPDWKHTFPLAVVPNRDMAGDGPGPRITGDGRIL